MRLLASWLALLRRGQDPRLGAVRLDAVCDESQQVFKGIEVRELAAPHVLGAAGNPALADAYVGVELDDKRTNHG
jgi:hypothetical protein